jgi:hypothetical protein
MIGRWQDSINGKKVYIGALIGSEVRVGPAGILQHPPIQLRIHQS